MTLGNLMEMHVNRALKISYDEGATVANLGGMTITLEQADQIVRKLGWTEYVPNAFEMIKKTDNLMNYLKKSPLAEGWSDNLWRTTQIVMQNKRGMTYGKTFDRYAMTLGNGKRFTIIHGMEHAGAPYTVYEDGNAIPFAKCRTLNKATESLVQRVN